MHGDESTYKRLTAMGLPDEEIAERFIRAIDPRSFPLRPIYIAWMDELGERFTETSCGGYTNSILDLALRPWLEKRQKWQGRGLAMVLKRNESTGVNVAGAVHEYIHRVDCAYSAGHWDYDPAALKPGELPSPDILESNWRPSFTNTGRFPWYQHEPIQFGRLAVHAVTRAHSLGFPKLDYIWWASYYGLSGLPEYIHAVYPEADAWREAERPLIELAATPPPAGLVELIDADKRRWLDRMLGGGPEDRAKLHAAIASEDSLAACVAPEAAATVHRWGCCKGAAPRKR